MTVRYIRPLAVAAGVFAGGAAVAQPADANQKLADAVAARLGAVPSAARADIGIACAGGVVTLTGTAPDAATKAAVIEAARVIPGVTKVRDGLAVALPSVRRVQAEVPPAALPPAAMPPPDVSAPAVPGAAGPVVSPVPSAMAPSAGGPVVEPAPLGGVGLPSAPGDAPPLPPYAWPTYAPYNNVSRVAYPQAYPYNAFPFIGPFYPFPKVPLGWRSVRLDWEDGHWFLGRTSAPHDYWRVRFW